MHKSEGSTIEEFNKIFSIIKKRKSTIIFTVILSIVISVISVYFIIQPKYQSTSEIIVNQKLDKDTQATEQQQIQSADLQLVNTYKSILNSQTISKDVMHKVGSAVYSGTSLNVSTDTSSQVISIVVTSSNPKYAAKVANATATTFRKKVKDIMNVNNVSIISKASANNKPIFPNKPLGVLLGLIIGLLLGSSFALIKEYSDTTVSDSSFIEDDLNLVNLGTISDIDMKNIKKQIKNKG